MQNHWFEEHKANSNPIHAVIYVWTILKEGSMKFFDVLGRGSSNTLVIIKDEK